MAQRQVILIGGIFREILQQIETYCGPKIHIAIIFSYIRISLFCKVLTPLRLELPSQLYLQLRDVSTNLAIHSTFSLEMYRFIVHGSSTPRDEFFESFFRFHKL